MKKFSFILLLAISMANSTQAQDFQAPSTDNAPGGWNFNILSTNISNQRTTAGYSYHWRHTWSVPTTALYFGFVGGAKQADGISIDMGQSYEFGLDYILSTEASLCKGIKFSIGLGTGWKNYRMTNQTMFFSHDDGTITLESYPEGANPKFSRIHTWGLNVPMALSFRLDKRARSVFSIGPELYFTPHACLKTRYSIDGEKQTLKEKNLHFNKVTVGLRTELAIGAIGIYYKYNPFDVLDTNYAPEFCSMSAGLKVFLDW